MEDYFTPLEDPAKLQLGTIIRRLSDAKYQQGGFVKTDEEGNLILINVIDLFKGELLANEGILRPEPSDQLYYSTSSFKNHPKADEALQIIKDWPLYRENISLQSSILQFTIITFVPEQILRWKKEDRLSMLFVPIQQKFRIGRFKERRNPDRVCKEQFKMWLDSLHDGDHITYVALVTDKKSDVPKYFSLGTKPHMVTESALMGIAYNFKPNHGGHIKASGKSNGRKHFLVDAGSDHLGRGIKTAIKDAEKVVKGLKMLYPEYEFTPLEGRGAFGHEQSF